MKWFFSLALLVFSCAHGSRLHAQASAPTATGRVMIEQGDVNQESVASTEAKLAELDADANVTEIYLRINSHGGDVEAGFRLAQYFPMLHKPLTCVTDFMAWSMGAVIMESCPTRLITPRSTMMFHEVSSVVNGNVHDMMNAESFSQAMSEAVVQVAAARLNISADKIRGNITGKQWVLSASEALSVGAVDAIVSPKDLPRLTEYPKPAPLLLELLRGS